MPPTRPGVSIIGPLFFHRAARDLVGRLSWQRACFADIPHAMACFEAPAGGLGRHVASIMSTRRTCSGPSGADRRKPMFSEVGTGTGRPQISARTRAMMLMMLTVAFPRAR